MKDGQQTMSKTQLYPLRFDPIYQYRLWGGRRLASLLSAPLPGEGPIGEAWVLSDRTNHPSLVANGLLKGQTLGQVFGANDSGLVVPYVETTTQVKRERLFDCDAFLLWPIAGARPIHRWGSRRAARVDWD